MIVGAGMGLLFPTLASAGMSSLPPQVSGVGSGALNTLRQIGFSLGVALLVAVFTSQMNGNIDTAVHSAQRFVGTQTAIPAPARAGIDARLQQVAALAKKGGASPVQADSVLSGAPQAQPGTPQAQLEARLKTSIGAIFKDDIARSFVWPYYIAGLFGYLTIIPALFLGRRLGAHAGDQELSRGERAAAR